MTELIGKTALVTGAASGIGRAVAESLANRGATIIVHDRREEGREFAERINGHFLMADLASMDETRELAHRCLQTVGTVDILVNNAGIQHVSPVEDFDEKIWAIMMQVMLISPFQLIKWLLPRMKEQKWGRIINIGSIHGQVASPFKSAYVAAKHGLLGLTKAIALETGMWGITSNAVCPAYVRTPLVEEQILSQAETLGIATDEVVNQVMLEPAAIKRLIEPEEVAKLVCFLASPDAHSITGSSYNIDIGWTAR